jgi:hypothetical protein
MINATVLAIAERAAHLIPARIFEGTALHPGTRRATWSR